MDVGDPPAHGRGVEARPALPAALVEPVEVATVVVVVARPRPTTEDPVEVADGQLLPVDDVGDVLEQRPVGPARIGRRRARQPPRRVVQPGPGRQEAIPDGGLIGPEVTRGGAEVDRAQRGQGSAAEVHRAGRRGDLEGARQPFPSVRAGVCSPTLASSWSPSSTVRR